MVRDQEDVALELAACILAFNRRVGELLASEHPQLARLGKQARAAFAARQGDWSRLASTVIADVVALAPAGALPANAKTRAELADECVGRFGQMINSEAAGGLEEAMDLQVSKGIHPDVAWVRAVAGYGLPAGLMRNYIRAATATKDGTTTSLAAAHSLAETALLRNADQLANTEIKVWATMPVTKLAKAFDPHQRRDDDGKWTKTSGPKAQVRERVADRPIDGVDELLRQAPPDRYASVPPPERYADADRYSAASRYTAADRYASKPADDRYAAGDASTRYTAGDRYQSTVATRTNQWRILLIGGRAPNREPAATQVDDQGYGLYVPIEAVPDRHFDPAQAAFVQYGANGQIDFSTINAGNRYMNQPVVDAQHLKSPWGIAAGMPNITDDDWQAALDAVIPLWDRVMDNPARAISQLDPMELGYIAARAGYPARMGKTKVERLFADNEYLRANGDAKDGHRYDLGLTHALADYVVWINPQVMGDAGKEVGRVLDDRIGQAKLDGSPLPSVLSLTKGLHDDEDDMSELRGNYGIGVISYWSAIDVFRHGAPNGKIALREIGLEPEDRI